MSGEGVVAWGSTDAPDGGEVNKLRSYLTVDSGPRTGEEDHERRKCLVVVDSRT